MKWAEQYGNTYGFTIARYRVSNLQPIRLAC